MSRDEKHPAYRIAAPAVTGGVQANGAQAPAQMAAAESAAAPVASDAMIQAYFGSMSDVLVRGLYDKPLPKAVFHFSLKQSGTLHAKWQPFSTTDFAAFDRFVDSGLSQHSSTHCWTAAIPCRYQLLFHLLPSNASKTCS
jgi:hypothetical protein